MTAAMERIAQPGLPRHSDGGHYLYAAHFAGGLVKVGRAANPQRRVLQHRDRLSVAGIDLIESHAKPCAYRVESAEAALIARCAAAATARRSNEWFVGLSFPVVCGWLDEFAANEIPEDPISAQSASAKAAFAAAGGLSVLAAGLGLSVQAVSNWRVRGVPAERCPEVERVLSGRMTCEQLRTDLRWVRLPDPLWHPAGRPCLDVAPVMAKVPA